MNIINDYNYKKINNQVNSENDNIDSIMHS